LEVLQITYPHVACTYRVRYNFNIELEYTRLLISFSCMSSFKVKGADETVENVDILGEVRKVGDVLEMSEEEAAPLVAEGKLEAFVAEEQAPAGEPVVKNPETPAGDSAPMTAGATMPQSNDVTPTPEASAPVATPEVA
jgi:hypothetical protein